MGLGQYRGSLSTTAFPLLRRRTNLIKAVIERGGDPNRYSHTYLLIKGSKSEGSHSMESIKDMKENLLPKHLRIAGEISGRMRHRQHEGLQVAVYHDLHSKGTSKSMDSIPTLPIKHIHQTVHV